MNRIDLKRLFAAWGWAIFALVGVLLAGAGIGIVSFAVDGWKNPVAGLCFAFAQAILAAGMVAGVLRASQSIGFFKDELRAVLYADDFDGSLIDAKRAWRSLTDGLFRQRFAELKSESLDGFDFDALIGSAEYYYEQHWRKVTIDWKDETKTSIAIVEQVDARLRTASIAHQVSFTNSYAPEADESRRWLQDYRFSEGFDYTLSEADVTTRKDGRQEVRADLPSGRSMRLQRTTEKVQRIDVDPFINYRSNCLWACPEVVIHCNAPDLRFYFRSMGTRPFVPRGTGDIDGLHASLIAQCKSLCLPSQGYMIVVVKVTQ